MPVVGNITPALIVTHDEDHVWTIITFRNFYATIAATKAAKKCTVCIAGIDSVSLIVKRIISVIVELFLGSFLNVV